MIQWQSDVRSPTPWLAALTCFGSVEEMRGAALARHPAFAPVALNELAVVGAADEGRRFVGLCAEHGIAVRAITDDDPKKRGTAIGSSEVAPVDSLAALDKSTPIVIASHRVLAVSDRVRAMGFANVAPLALLQVLYPGVFPPHMFYAGWFEDLFEHRDRYQELAETLADDMSRRVLEALVGFRLTLDVGVLRPIIEWELYHPAGLFTYGNDEVYVDGGSYDGDTIRLFVQRVHGRFARVLAFEPDRASFQRLLANFAHEARVKPINAGLHKCKATLRFDSAGTRGSSLVDQGGTEISVVALDDILEGERVSFIKMNIEGAELEALRGAAQAIRRWRPKLAVSAYHRPSDLWRIPALVGELDLDYKLYLRQHDGGVIETVLYALP